MKKMWKYAAVVLVCVLTLGACGNLDSSKTSGDAAQDRKIQIGMSFDSFVIERWQTDRDIFVSTAKELGAEVTSISRKACRQRHKANGSPKSLSTPITPI